MSAGTENELACIVAEESVFGRHGNGVGGRFLLGEAHFVLYAEFLLHGGYCFGELGFEELAVVCRNSEVETYLAAFRGRSLSAFCKLLFEGCAHAVGVAVECEERFGELAVVEAVGLYDCGHKFFVSAGVNKAFNSGAFAIEASHGGLQLVIEGEIGNFLYELSHWRAFGGLFLGAVHKGEEGLEHSRRSTGRGHKFEDVAAVGQKTVPAFAAGFLKVCIGHEYTLSGSRRRLYAKIGEAGAETLKLSFDRTLGDAFFLELLKVGGSEFFHDYDGYVF